MIFRVVALIVLMAAHGSPAFAFCIAGVGNSCLPNEKDALQHITASLARLEQPTFPVVTTIYITRLSHASDRFVSEVNPSARAERDAKKNAINNSILIARSVAEDILRGESCQRIMTVKISEILGVNGPFNSFDKSKGLNECEIMEVLKTKNFLSDIKADVKVTLSEPYVFYDISIVASDTPKLKALATKTGLPVVKIGAPKVEKKLYQRHSWH